MIVNAKPEPLNIVTV